MSKRYTSKYLNPTFVNKSLYMAIDVKIETIKLILRFNIMIPFIIKSIKDFMYFLLFG